jgi:chromosomal replication initiator protein
MNIEQIWQAVLGEMELSISRANFTTWFKQTFISEYNEAQEQLIIGVPNNFTKSWLEKKYNQEIVNILKRLTGKNIKKIFYKIEIRKTAAASNLHANANADTDTGSTKNREVASASYAINRFGLNSRYVFDSFVVGKGNELAHAACRAIVANPGKTYNPLFIYGGVGLGKTHLLQAVGHDLALIINKIVYVSCEKFTNEYVEAVRTGKTKDFKDRYRGADLLLIDDIQFMGGKDGTQEELFHTFNELHQINKQVVITSDRPPKSIPALEKRLLSRLEWGMIVDMGQPDTETRLAILEKKCREKNYMLERDILDYLAANIQNNIRELEGALNRLIVFHEFNNTKPTLETTKGVLNNILASAHSKSITSKAIVEAVGKFFDISIKDMIGKCRKQELVRPRQITMYLMRIISNTSYPTIGQELGGRDHTTAMHAFNKISNDIKENEKIKQDVESIKQIIQNNYS